MSDLTSDDLIIMSEQADEIRTIPVRGNSGPNTAFIKECKPTGWHVTLVSDKANIIDHGVTDNVDEWLASREDW